MATATAITGEFKPKTSEATQQAPAPIKGLPEAPPTEGAPATPPDGPPRGLRPGESTH